MMETIILGLLIFSLIGFIVWREKHFMQEKQQLISLKLSENVSDFKFSTAPVSKEKKIVELSADYMEEQSLSDEDWFEAIRKTNEVN